MDEKYRIPFGEVTIGNNQIKMKSIDLVFDPSFTYIYVPNNDFIILGEILNKVFE